MNMNMTSDINIDVNDNANNSFSANRAGRSASVPGNAEAGGRGARGAHAEAWTITTSYLTAMNIITAIVHYYYC